MPFDLIKKLRQTESALDRRIDEASRLLAGDKPPTALASAFRSGRVLVRHPSWRAFLLFARPVNEAREHISGERAHYENRLEAEIADAVLSIKKGRAKK
jgi:hypothetical protein